MVYQELIEEIRAHCHRADVGPHIPGFIQRAEERFNRELKTPFQEKTAYNDMMKEYIHIPEDMLSVRRAIRASDGKAMRYMRPIDYQDFIDNDPVKRSANESDVEPRWTIEDMQFRVYPHPTALDVYRVRILYFERIPQLSDATPINWLLKDHSDLYLSQSLINARRFVVDQEQVAQWESTVRDSLNYLKSLQLTSLTAQNLRTDLAGSTDFDIVSGWR